MELAPTPSSSTITIAVCTHSPDDAVFGRVLGAACRHLDDPSVLEVLVVDNNSTPPLAERDAVTKFPVRLIEQPVTGLTAAREAAIRATEGDIIVFIDDDNILDEDYLDAVQAEFVADDRIGVVGGRIVPEYEASPPSWFDAFEGSLAIRRPLDRTVVTRPPWTEAFPVGAGLAIRREIALEYLRDSTEVQRIQGRRGTALSSGEDLDLDLFALSRGWKLVAINRSGLTHVIPSNRCTADYLVRLAKANAVSGYQLDRKWRPVFGGPIVLGFSTPLWVALGKAFFGRLLGIALPGMRVKGSRNWSLVRVRLWPPH